MVKKTIKDLSPEEFSELLRSSGRYNHIELNGISVISSVESLKSCEKTLNRLLKRHGDSLVMRKVQKSTIGYE